MSRGPLEPLKNHGFNQPSCHLKARQYRKTHGSPCDLQRSLPAIFKFLHPRPPNGSKDLEKNHGRAARGLDPSGQGTSAEHSRDKLFQLHDVRREGAYAVGSFLGGHGVLVEHETEIALVEGDFLMAAGGGFSSG